MNSRTVALWVAGFICGWVVSSALDAFTFWLVHSYLA